MPIQLTDRDAGSPQSRSLIRAAIAAQRAPSLRDLQPWGWQIGGGAARLRVNRTRQLRSIDPDGRLMILSCGMALHHATTALAAHGSSAVVERGPDLSDTDLLATVHITEASGQPPSSAVQLLRAITSRRTDRRPYADRPVPDSALTLLRSVAQASGARLHFPGEGQLTELAPTVQGIAAPAWSGAPPDVSEDDTA
jgi:hypothetical protein